MRRLARAGVYWRSFLNPRVVPWITLVLVGIVSMPTLRFVWHRSGSVRGWEADAIAKAIVSGQGFSFAGTERWLWEKWKGNPNEYFPTAWVDPVFTYLLAGAHWVFGHYVYLAMYACTFLCIGLMCVCSYRTAMRFGGAWVGGIAVLILAANLSLGKAFFDDITNSALAAATVSAAALVCVRYFEQPSLKRAAVMGLAIGFTVLACPATTYFPVLLMAAVVLFHRSDLKTSMGRTAVLVLCAAAVIAPWTIRNYVTFGDFILVRNGAGQIAWDGTVGPASTFIHGAAKSPVPPPWRSSGPTEAVQNMLKKELRIPVHRYQVQSLTAAPVPGYQSMDEAERDELSMSRAIQFVVKHPLVSAQMAAVKVWIYCTRFGTYGLLVLMAALAAAVIGRRDARTWPLTLLAISYSLPFVLVIAYFGRYRAPIEPVFSVLAAIAAAQILTSPLAVRIRETLAARFARPDASVGA